MARVLVATIKSWNIRRYHEWAARGQHVSRLIQAPSELTEATVADFAPDYIFFPHWSWKIPPTLYERYECIVFHMTDLPFGRGGSPLQNLLARGIYHTQVSSLRVVEAMDAGPIYAKRPLCLHGNASEIYMRASELAFQMMDEILERRPTPVSQTGEVVEFKRRTPAQSEIPPGLNLTRLYDFIRMLDAEGYPQAFLDHAGFRYEFSRATLRDGHIVADVKIIPIEKDTI
jgi:methionyl-tRNA formyltransferase